MLFKSTTRTYYELDSFEVNNDNKLQVLFQFIFFSGDEVLFKEAYNGCNSDSLIK